MPKPKGMEKPEKGEGCKAPCSKVVGQSGLAVQDSEFIPVVALQDVVAVILFLASMAVVTPECMPGSYEKGFK